MGRGSGGIRGGGWMGGNWRGPGVIRICCKKIAQFCMSPFSINGDVSCQSVLFPMFQSEHSISCNNESLFSSISRNTFITKIPLETLLY
jgi:hypothetical protein